MTISQTRKVARGGFTLIELLVVIAIIAILVSLTAVAVMRVLVMGPQLNDRHDIEQLSLALGEFNAKFGSYPPSRLILHPRAEMYNPTSQLDNDSKVFLLKMWPRLGQGPWGATGTGGLDWNGDGTPGNAADSIDLHGQHCLVFFLGGMQTNVGANGCVGFSTNPTNPTLPQAPGETRVGPFFDFKSNRLIVIPGQLFSYATPYGTDRSGNRMPYLYFSSGKSLNSYLRYGGGANSDCAPYGLPYTLSGAPGAAGARYHNQDSFQIISAGANQQFGPGGPWTSAGAESMPPAGKDDMTNFHSRMMGIPE